MKKEECYQRPNHPATQSALKTIRWGCMDCTCGSARDVQACPDRLCAYWPWRFGMTPATANKNGKDVTR
jgi:hypothetical protein